MNAYTSVSGGGFQPPSPTFDNKGNTLTQPRANGITQTLTWDGHDRLRTATSLTTPSATAQMAYDPLGRLTWVRRPDGANPPIDEIWSWSSWTLLSREVRQGSTPLDTFRYTWGPDLSGTLEGAGGVGGLLAVEHAPGTSSTWDIRHHHFDANGNVLALTNAIGQVSARYRYSPFGELISSSDLDNSGWNTRNIHRFSTKPEVASTGLLYYGYRWYDAQTGRWPSRDPIEEEGGMNLYGFLDNEALTSFDIFGLAKPKTDWECQQHCIKTCRTRGGSYNGHAFRSFPRTVIIAGAKVTITIFDCLCKKCKKNGGSCSCDLATVGNENPPGSCPSTVNGIGETAGDCQRDAKSRVDACCRKFVTHCHFTKN